MSDLLALARCLLGEGARFLHVFWHSPSLVPGLSPFVRSDGTASDSIGAWRSWWRASAKIATLQPATVSECADSLCPAPLPPMR